MVHEHDGNRSTGDDHDAVAKEDKAEHIVQSVEPEAVHDKVQFHKDRTERKETDDQHGRYRAEVLGCWWDLSGYLVCAHRSLESLIRSVEYCSR